MAGQETRHNTPVVRLSELDTEQKQTSLPGYGSKCTRLRARREPETGALTVAWRRCGQAVTEADLVADLMCCSHVDRAGEALQEVRLEVGHRPRLAKELVRQLVLVHVGHLAEEAVGLGVQGAAHLLE